MARIPASVCWLIYSINSLHAQPETVLRSETRVVQVDVVVKDSKGKAVDDLTREDFELTTFGKHRDIKIFSVDRGERPAGNTASLTRPSPLPPGVYTNKNHSLEQPGRVTAILLDGLNTTFDDFVVARKLIGEMIPKLEPGETVAVYLLYRGIKVVQEYTSDHALLRKSVDSFIMPALTSRPGPGGTAGGANFRYSQRTQVDDDLSDSFMTSEEKRMLLQRRALQLFSAFRAVSGHLARIPGRKTVVWVSGGFSTFQIQESKTLFDKAIEDLNEANVALYAVDARGLLRSRGRNLDTLERFATATGGKTFSHRNDLGEAVREAIQDSHTVYTLGFYLSETKSTAISIRWESI